jgi:hypothetical protein
MKKLVKLQLFEGVVPPLNLYTRNTLVSWMIAVITFMNISATAFALDKKGNFESKQEQDAFIAATLKKTASELNSQAPIQVDEDTLMMSVFALQKTITFNMRLPRAAASDIDSNRLAQEVRQNLNHTVCQSKATRDLIDMGVEYIYLYYGNDGRLITRVVINSYQ